MKIRSIGERKGAVGHRVCCMTMIVGIGGGEGNCKNRVLSKIGDLCEETRRTRQERRTMTSGLRAF